MNKPYIEFKQQRDFGAILSVTFGFLRNEFKPFMKAIFNIAGPAIILFIAAMALYTYVVGDIFNFDIYGDNPTNNFNPLIILFVALVYLVSFVAAYILAGSTALHYLKSYIDNKGNVNIADVKRKVYKTFWGFLGLGILKGITLGFALVLCILPVFYAMVPMAIVLSIYVFETRRSATDAYSHSFYLVNEDFWTALGTFIVLGLIFYALSMVVSIPTIIYLYAKMGIFSGEIDPANMTGFVDPIYILLNVLNTLFQFLLNFILVIGGAVVYFHLNEKRNFTGTYERISNIGEHIEK
ncbi:hypothetical protein [Winogradskyella immobilis]|uniref:Glycerophosphoryl diester phosphodiesterase membrane domain-containing protein n=1 Tax=Winogradskyella immobilis TaxID=2816852 RepID=A0ABS8EPR4_9FLAO|nr:hypothetical protein [Winogradskyella immobilis]MCC1484982.1 hypothetical protein [Winogradskyella immobilis]MCG0017074.1 hypothetical protein [Winogradskyella immobilis]